MLIGSDFNRRCEMILLAAGKESEYEADRKIDVSSLTQKLNLDRVEIRSMFQYLIDKKLIRIETIGGPQLYGHISLTGKGLMKIRAIQKRKD